MGALPVSRSIALRPSRLLLGVFLGVCGALSFFPFFLMITTSFKPISEIFEAGLRFVPRRPIVDNYVQVFTQSLMPRVLLNGVVVTTLTLAGQLLVSIPAAYALARMEFPGRTLAFSLVLAALVFPRYIAAVPSFLIISRLKLIDTYAALILPFIGTPFAIFLLRQYFLQVPAEFFDAASIDGCTLAQMLVRVLLPLIRPAIGAFAIFSIVAHWNDFFWPLVVTRSSRMFTPPAGIVYFADAEAGTKWSVIMAAAIVIIAPLILAFLVGRRQFIASMTHTAVKG
jgi:multiple sugar transport system permease protein